MGVSFLAEGLFDFVSAISGGGRKVPPTEVQGRQGLETGGETEMIRPALPRSGVGIVCVKFSKMAVMVSGVGGAKFPV